MHIKPKNMLVDINDDADSELITALPQTAVGVQSPDAMGMPFRRSRRLGSPRNGCIVKTSLTKGNYGAYFICSLWGVGGRVFP